ncbi:MAG: acyl-CoA dehydrogenase family protein, partial [Blastococcus sp.]
MNFDLGTDQRDAAAGARAFFSGSASPAAARAALEGGAIEPGHKALAEIGFLGITVAEDAGGA